MKLRILITVLLAFSLIFALAACADPAESTEANPSVSQEAGNKEETTLGDYFDNDEVQGEEIGGLE